MATYNDTAIVDANTWTEIAVAMNNLSGGLLFTFAIILLIITYWVVFKKQNFKDVFLAGSFFGAIISTLIWGQGLVNNDFIIVPWIMFLAAVLLYIFDKD